jgi:tRNA A37 threonylcarbamoyladenosine dehydratase
MPLASLFSQSYQHRFGGLIRLYGTQACYKLLHSHVLIIGIGGVGSWIAEALARSGVGTITLMDLDEICVTNTNRQIHTTCHTVGQSKTTIMAKRLQDINPEVTVHCIDDFIDKRNLAEHIHLGFSLVCDAIDNAIDKTEIIAYCKKNQQAMITIGSSGGKKDPSKIAYDDLTKTTGDPMFLKIRNNLRRKHGFSRDTKQLFGIEAIYSAEPMIYPDNKGETSSRKDFIQPGEKLDCGSGYGACTMMTASFGLLAASRAIETIINIEKSP